MKLRLPLHIHISTLFLVLILLVGGGIALLGYQSNRAILDTSARQLSERIGRETSQEFVGLLRPAEMATRLLSLGGIAEARTLGTRLAYLGQMREALRSASETSGFYVGYANGDFFLVRRIWQDAERALFDAPAGTRYVVQSIERGGKKPYACFIFFDDALVELRRDERAGYAAGYDPRERDWYKAAQATPGQIKTAPYVFFTTNQVGITIANRSPRRDAVIGADIRLENIERSLAGQKFTPTTALALVARDGTAIAGGDAGKTVVWPDGPQGKPALAQLRDLRPAVFAEVAPMLAGARAEAAQDVTLAHGDGDWRVTIRPLSLEGVRDPLFLIVAIPDRELMAAAHALLRKVLLLTLLLIAVAVPVTWALARLVSKPLRSLADEAEAIRHFEFAEPIRVSSPVLEVSELAATMDTMKRTIRRFMDVSMAVAAERDFERLLPHLLAETIAAAEADAGVLFLCDDGGLQAAAARRANGEALPLGDARIAANAAGPLMSQGIATCRTQVGLLGAADIDALGLAPLATAGSGSHAIAVPLPDRQRGLVGMLLLVRRGETDPAHLRFIEALAGSAAVSLEAKELIRAQKRLFEGFVQLIAGAIDAKSPYTGGHCARVPELTKMIARAACAATSGPYRDFALDDDAWEALHLAAWLHDCGKVTTPEYVVDKATKLETLHDRIHEIRTRFEVLKRDAEIRCLEALAAGTPERAARATLAAEIAALDDDFAFVAACNEGGECMSAEARERLQRIAARTWQRTLDDGIGISHEERARRGVQPAQALPVTEFLLADKAAHRHARRAQDAIADDNPWGFRMAVPALLYDRGELHNLSVARGTLTEEERYKINEHIVQTFMMLAQLPFPKHLRDVPEIAAGHHEKMDGSGYPRRLRREQLSPLARMMAIADIFEALTAIDRPYKKGKTVSEAIRIMAFMKNDQHIDAELFELFLASGVYRDYAERFLQPEQIDAVDVAAYLASGAAAGGREV